MQQLTSVNYETSEKHKDLTKSRQAKYMADTCEMLELLQSRNPFSDNCNLRSIATCINTESSVNVDTSKTVGVNILEKMIAKNVLQHTFKIKDQVVTLCAFAVKINQETTGISDSLLQEQSFNRGIS